MTRSLVASLVVASIAGCGLLACQRSRDDSAQESPARSSTPTAGAGPARVLLNEVVFLPPAGQPQWVELINAGGQPASLDGIQLESHTGAKFGLPQGQTLSPGAVRVVRFDGQSAVDANAIHSTLTSFLGAAGFVQVRGGVAVLDRIAWGDGQSGAANLSRGGDQEDPTPGMSIGRVPRTITSDPLEWVSFSATQTTEGRANPQPAVEILLPMDGAIVMPDNTSLNWYPAPGAARYRVQIAGDRSFGAPVFDQAVDQPVATPTLSPGSYVWRVQAIAADGTAAEYSPVSALTVRRARAVPGRGRAFLDWLLPYVHAQGTSAGEEDDELPKVLDVPMIKQHKDTRMLIIESRREFDHGWDSDHRDLHPQDPADNANCATASIAMVTAFYGGKLSQDRINYEVFKDVAVGPQGDLKWGRGTSDSEKVRAIKFALGREPTIERPTDESWIRALISTRVDAGTPMIFCKTGHCTVIVGSTEPVGTTMVINDPWRGSYLAPVRNVIGGRILVMADVDVGKSWSVHPRSDEPEVSRDSDGDGVVDFDEIHRFQTDPNDKDSDQDELPDKEDIKASVLDPRHGFAFGGNGRDFDGDGKMMELDDDSDDGGCLDGWEDVNKNGKYERERKEMDFFQNDDDPCIKGTLELRNDETWDVPGSVRTRNTLLGLTRYAVSLRPLDAERWEGRASVKFDSRTTTVTDTPSSHCEESSVTVQKPYVLLLAADGRASPGGRIDLTVRLTPGAAPPPLRLVWKNSCSTPQSGAVESPSGPAAWPWPRLTLVNGVYDENSVRDTPPRAGASGSGKWITKVHLEQKRVQR